MTEESWPEELKRRQEPFRGGETPRAGIDTARPHGDPESFHRQWLHALEAEMTAPGTVMQVARIYAGCAASRGGHSAGVSYPALIRQTHRSRDALVEAHEWLTGHGWLRLRPGANGEPWREGQRKTYDLTIGRGGEKRRPVRWTPCGIVGPRERQGPDGDGLPVAQTESDEQVEMLTMALTEMAEPAAETALYRFWDGEGRLLYIGITDELLGRVRAHTLGSSWMNYATRATIERYPTRKAAAGAEEAAIKAEQPLFNDVHNRTPEARQRLVEFLIEHGRTDLLAPVVTRG